MQYNALHYPYPSKRTVTYARNGMVATSQPLAAQAGLDMIKQGGNAIDAAIATAACLTVVEPTSNGIGSDAFALIWTKGKLHGLNGSGPAPQSISIDQVKAQGHSTMPPYGWIPVTVPGTPATWVELSKRFGKLPLSKVLTPAIDYAEHGYPLSPVLSYFWKRGFNNFKIEGKGPEFKHWFETFTPEDRPPVAGEIWRSPGHAQTLQLIAETDAKAFYQGELAEKMDAFSQKHRGYLRGEDLESFKPEWVDPIHTNYRGYDVWEIPPNGQGVIALMALNMMQGFEFSHKDSVDLYHKQIEATKLAFTDGFKYITEHSKMTVSVESLLSENYAEKARNSIGEMAHMPDPGKPPKGGTVYLSTADGEGNMVSYIQSNYMGFGSGLVVPGTGISLQNRGYGFSLDPNHDNRLEGGKRTYHTIIPGFLTKDNQAVGPFGVMGGFMQPQGHLQVAMNLIDFNLNPQAAIDAPRWQWLEGKTVAVESGVPQHIVQSLLAKGHDIQVSPNSDGFGRGQIILRDNKSGVLAGGTESRTDGTIAAW